MLRIQAIAGLLFRILLLAICGLAPWHSIRIAVADWLANAGTIDGFESAVRYAPDDARLLARSAMFRSENDDPSPAVDEDLRRAVRLNPLDAGVLMTLGLREEFRGKSAEAEGALIRAAQIDRQFKPAWTLANYYYRANHPEKGWPLIQRILNLEPLGFDPAPVFELAWRQAADDPTAGNQIAISRKILAMIPKRGHKPVQYLEFLIASKRADAAYDAWADAIATADFSGESDRETMTGLADFLAGADRISEAVTVWNQLVDRGIVHSGRLDPAKGKSMADPDFKFAPYAKAFGWRVADNPAVVASGFSGSVRFEINGDEPQTLQILSTFAPVLPATRYRLRWKSDGSSLSSPQDPGLSFRIVQQPDSLPKHEIVTQCQPLLVPGNPDGCDFVTLKDSRVGIDKVGMDKVRIDLQYARALGTKRVSGVLELSSVRLEPAR